MELLVYSCMSKHEKRRDIIVMHQPSAPSGE